MIGDARPADAVIGAGVLLSPNMCKLALDLLEAGIQAERRNNAGGQVPAGTSMLRETLRAGSRLRARQGADVVAVRRELVPASTGLDAETLDAQEDSTRWWFLREASKASGFSCGMLRRLARAGAIEGAMKTDSGWLIPAGTTIERRRH